MDNQHRKIKGYRDLTQEDIDAMNSAKTLEESVLSYITLLENVGKSNPRWLAIAKTDLQKGFMALGRAIARPEGD